MMTRWTKRQQPTCPAVACLGKTSALTPPSVALNLPLTLPFCWQEEEELKELAEQGYSEDQLKMLYMVALYSHQA